MINDFQETSGQPATGDLATDATQTASKVPQPGPFTRWLTLLAGLGLGESLLRFAANGLTLILVVAVVWLMRLLYGASAQPSVEVVAAQPTATPQAAVILAPLSDGAYHGVPRFAKITTIIPNRPRTQIIKYVVQPGDTIIGIAEKFGLKPQTVLWGNYYILKDDVHKLRPGQELNILPVDGTYYEWQPGDGLGAVARYFGVTPEDIINYPANNLNPDGLTNLANPDIKPGTWLIVPGGRREFFSWSAPIGITRTNPATARQMGPGACGTIRDGAVGYGSFIWPSNKHYLSGFDYSPETNHRGIDIAGNLGEALYAVDAGVVVYSGWNDWGYGYMIVIDHGTGWQSLYAHASAINVACGQSVGQGDVIGAIGSTGNSSGPHLHFELMHTTYGKVNPWDFLPPP
ncbi:MAG: M23 family metallopeptidase [Anaerolineales bacterium]